MSVNCDTADAVATLQTDLYWLVQLLNIHDVGMWARLHNTASGLFEFWVDISAFSICLLSYTLVLAEISFV